MTDARAACAPLPFGFARRFGILLEQHGNQWGLAMRADTPLTALAEARRMYQRELPLRLLSPECLYSRRSSAELGLPLLV